MARMDVTNATNITDTLGVSTLILALLTLTDLCFPAQVYAFPVAFIFRDAIAFSYQGGATKEEIVQYLANEGAHHSSAHRCSWHSHPCVPSCRFAPYRTATWPLSLHRTMLLSPRTASLTVALAANPLWTRFPSATALSEELLLDTDVRAVGLFSSSNSPLHTVSHRTMSQDTVSYRTVHGRYACMWRGSSTQPNPNS